MERLWAPWRNAFVTGKEANPIPRGPTGCIFCDYPRPAGAPDDESGRVHDRDRLVVRTREHALVIMNKFPYAPGHVMVVPRRHVDQVEALPEAEFQALQSLLRETVAAVRSVYKPEGMNVGMNMGRAGGAGIADHVHWHIVPRWVGDTNFMPVFSDTRVINESILDAYDKLRAALPA